MEKIGFENLVKRQNNMCHIPLLDIPALIAEKYKNNPICVQKNMVLPVPCNQRMNSYLKEIADMCGITKKVNDPYSPPYICMHSSSK